MSVFSLKPSEAVAKYIDNSVEYKNWLTTDDGNMQLNFGVLARLPMPSKKNIVNCFKFYSKSIRVLVCLRGTPYSIPVWAGKLL